MRTMITITAAALLAGCGGNAPADNAAGASADKLQPGEYEATIKVTALSSSDKTEPATKLKVAAAGDAPIIQRACIAEDGSIDPALFAEPGDKCSPTTTYVSSGRISIQLTCSRADGGLGMIIDGNFNKADEFDATVTSNTYFTGRGDYTATRTVTAKRIGNCPPPTAPTAPEAPKAG